MKTNIGTLDRLVRILAGLGLFAAGFYFKSWWGVIGVIPLVTAFVGFCPLYLPLGLSTCSRTKNDAGPRS